jgi:hypothetical protein
MDIFFQDPNEVPLPPEEVRIRELRVQPWPDGQRVKIYLEVDPFQKKPNAEIIITNTAGQEVASASIIESMVRKMELTMHLREGKPGGQYKLRATLFYTQAEEQESENAQGETEAPPRQVISVVDQAETHFEVENG